MRMNSADSGPAMVNGTFVFSANSLPATENAPIVPICAPVPKSARCSALPLSAPAVSDPPARAIVPLASRCRLDVAMLPFSTRSPAVVIAMPFGAM